MKAPFPTAALAALLLAACEPFVIPSAVRCLVMDGGGRPDICRRDSTGRVAGCDTTVLLCAVEVPRSYDWIRDTAPGSSGGRLILYRNYEPVFSMETGDGSETDSAPGTHHLLDGHLYTEFAGNRETVIKRDGEPLCRYSGQERLLGLLPTEDGLLTLGAPEGHTGFNLRRDGTVLLSGTDCRVFGAFGEASRERSGALYTDSGHWYFAYSNGQACYLVRDGVSLAVSMPVQISRVLAVRSIGGETWMVGRNSSSCILSHGKQCRLLSSDIVWEGADILPCRSGICVWGYGRTPEGRHCSIMQWPDSGRQEIISAGMGYLYIGDDGAVQVVGLEGGRVCLRDSCGTVFSRGDCLLMDRDCAFSAGGRSFLALSPTDGGKPFVWEGGRIREVAVYGYLTALEVSLAR